MFGKRELARIVGWQLGCTGGATIIFALTVGVAGAAASAAGGVIAIVANITMALIALSGGSAAPRAVMYRFYVAEASKLFVIMASLGVAFKLFNPPAAPLLVTFALALLAHWGAVAFVRRPSLTTGGATVNRDTDRCQE